MNKNDTMNTDSTRSDYVTRDAILKLLSDEEVARVSTKEGGPALATGDEYVDLEHLHQGVRRMDATTKVKIGDVLPRSAVADTTWSKICARLATVDGIRS
ncbi:hypothetical protein BH09MYX1_BH09MYX1_26810 [soil metagenome]